MPYDSHAKLLSHWIALNALNALNERIFYTMINNCDKHLAFGHFEIYFSVFLAMHVQCAIIMQCALSTVQWNSIQNRIIIHSKNLMIFNSPFSYRISAAIPCLGLQWLMVNGKWQCMNIRTLVYRWNEIESNPPPPLLLTGELIVIVLLLLGEQWKTNWYLGD